MITAAVIKELSSPNISFISGSLQAVASKVTSPQQAEPDSLVFISTIADLELALKGHAPIIVAHKSLSPPSDINSTWFTAPDIRMAMATVLPLFDGKMNRFNQVEKIHSTAQIHPGAHLGVNVCLGPFVVIGEGARIGDYTTIGAHTVVECFAIIGDHTLIHPQVFIGAFCEVGSHCEIHPHTTIGSDGFAFAPNKEGQLKKIPQIGKVVIGNEVEIGANCTVDRAALTETRIGNGTKLDNLCHIAHNVVIGKNCAIAAGFAVAGSTTVGNNCMFGGRVAVADHVTICDNVIVGGSSGITNDIKQPGAYAGFPIEPLRENLKTLASLGNGNLPRMRKQLNKIMKHLGLNEE